MGHSTKGVRIKGQIKDRTRLSFTVSLIKYTGCTAQCGAPVTSVTSRRSSPTNRLTGSHWALSNTALPPFPPSFRGGSGSQSQSRRQSWSLVFLYVSHFIQIEIDVRKFGWGGDVITTQLLISEREMNISYHNLLARMLRIHFTAIVLKVQSPLMHFSLISRDISGFGNSESSAPL